MRADLDRPRRAGAGPDRRRGACRGCARRSRHRRSRPGGRAGVRAACSWSRPRGAPASARSRAWAICRHASVVFCRDGRYAYRVRPRRRADQGRPAGGPARKADRPGGQRDRRRHLAGRHAGRRLQLRAGRREGLRRRDARPGRRHPGRPTARAARSKVVGLVDAPGQRSSSACTTRARSGSRTCSDPAAAPRSRKFTDVGEQPYDGLITPDGRYYIAGLFGEDGLALLDLWDPDKGVRRILDGYGRGEEPLPVYKMPHLEGWASAGDVLFLPAVGRHELLVVDTRTWQEVARIRRHGQPVFAVARPDGRQVWVNFAHPDNDVVQVIDVPTSRGRARPAARATPCCTSSSRRAASRSGCRCATTTGSIYDTANLRAPGDPARRQAERHLLYRARTADRPLSDGATDDTLERRAAQRLPARFSLVPRPFAEIAERLGVDEAEVLERLSGCSEAGS